MLTVPWSSTVYPEETLAGRLRGMKDDKHQLCFLYTPSYLLYVLTAVNVPNMDPTVFSKLWTILSSLMQHICSYQRPESTSWHVRFFLPLILEERYGIPA